MIIAADLHLGKISDSIRLKNGMMSQMYDTSVRLIELAEVAEKNHEPIIIAGDIFHTVNPKTEVIAEFFKWLGSTNNSGIQVILMAGNHDCGVDWMNLSMLSGLSLPFVQVVEHPSYLELEGREILCLPHIPLKDLEEIHKDHEDLGTWVDAIFPSKPELIVGHGMVKGLEYKNDIFFEAGDALEIDVRTFPKFRLMVLGHIHRHVRYTYRNRVVVYAGSDTVKNFGEVTDEKGYVRVDPKTLDWKFVPFTSEVTPYRDITIDLISKDEVVLDDTTLKKASMGAVVKIKVLARDRTQIDETTLRRAFNKYGYVSRFETVIQKSDKPDIDSENGGGVHFDLSHDRLVTEYVMGLDSEKEDIKKLAVSKGKKIIREVLDAE